jgi:hypothetical protein
MTGIQFQEAFLRGIGKLDDIANQPVTVDIENWLNEAILQLVKTKYSGNNPLQLGFEQSEKRMIDLEKLVKVDYKNTTINTDNPYTYRSIPSDLIAMVSDRVSITPKDGIQDDCWPTDSDGKYILKYTNSIPCVLNELEERLSNTLSEHNLHNGIARPLRVYTNGTIRYYSDDNYDVVGAELRYIRTPNKLYLFSSTDYSDLPLHIHDEIVKIAVRNYKLLTGDQTLPAYEQVAVGQSE